MADQSPKETPEERLDSAYSRMLERVRTAMDRAEKDTLPLLQEQIADAKERAVELGELTREEAERVGQYLRRDLEDAARYMEDSGNQLRQWLRFDLELIEDRLRDMFSLMVDHTRQELDRLAMQAREAAEHHTGEVTAMGTLRCTSCGQEMRLRKPGHIPPCPKCHGTRFTRLSA